MASNGNVTLRDITPEQSRGARGLLDWSRDQLATASGVPKRTIMRFEGRETTPRGATIAAIRSAFEAAGVEFIAQNGGGPGVRLRTSNTEPTTQASERLSVGPEDEVRGGHEAPVKVPGPTVPGTETKRRKS